MPDDRPQRTSFRDRHQDRHGPRPSGPPQSRPPFSPRPSGFTPKPPFTPRPAPDAVTVRLRDGDREVEIHGSLTICRQFLDELPGLWNRLRPAGIQGSAQPSIALPSPPAETAHAAVEHEERAAERADHRRNRHERDRTDETPARRTGQRSNGATISLDEEVIAVLRASGRPVGISEIRSRLREDVSGQAVRRILERSAGVTNVGGRPAAYRLR